MEDFNTQQGNEESRNTWEDTADTIKPDATGKSKTKHAGHGKTRLFKIR